MSDNPPPPTEAGHLLVDGHRTLTLAAVEQESELVTSYWLALADGTALRTPVPGQYLPISVDVPGYTISAYEAGRYRLSIKRERLPNRPPGRVSNHVYDNWAVGDLISAGVPQGHFVLDKTSSRPIVLLAGGIGVTPLLAMLRELAIRESARKVVLILAMRHRHDHPFQSEVVNLASRMPNLTVHVRYSERLLGVESGKAPNSYGLVDEALLRDLVPSPGVDVYLCGPVPFMNAMDQGLAALGVPDERIRYESFGPPTSATAARGGRGPIGRPRDPRSSFSSRAGSAGLQSRRGVTAPRSG